MAFQGDSIFWVEVEKVVPNPFQPRREFDEEKLRELADSIRMYGVLQPLTVTRKEVHTDDGAFYTQYELIAGERRLRASKLAGVEQVPVLIRSGEDTEQEKLELAIIENLQREDLNAVDRALAFKQLAEVFKLSHSQVAKKVGRSREYVSNSIRLLALPEVMLNSLKHGDLSEGHARTLLMLKDNPEEQDVVYREILLKKLSVREVERIARKIAIDKVRKKSPTDMDANLIELEREFTDTLGTRVQILKTDFGGKLTIDYFEEADLANLLEVVKSQNTKIAALKAVVAPSAIDDTVSETVIREMDTVTADIQTLAASTPLSPVDETEETSKNVIDEQEGTDDTLVNDVPAVPVSAPYSKEVQNSDTVPIYSSDESDLDVASIFEKKQTTVSNSDEVMQTDSPTPNNALQAELAAALATIEEAATDEKTIEENIAEAAQEYVPENPNEISRDIVAEVKEGDSHKESAASAEAPTDKKSDDEDGLYSVRNFSL